MRDRDQTESVIAIHRNAQAEVLTWVNRLIRVQFRELDLFGKMALRSRLIRTSNAYIFRDPLPCASAPQARGEGVMGAAQSREGAVTAAASFGSSSKSENPPRTQNQDFSFLSTATSEPKDRLAQALSRLKMAMTTKEDSMMR